MDNEIRIWREKTKHLPEFMRDFHNQKDLFKAISQYLEIEEGHPAENVSWVTAHCYTVDVFLWFMAQHGYTLQRSRASLNFDNVHETVAQMKKEQSEFFLKSLANSPCRNQDAT